MSTQTAPKDILADLQIRAVDAKLIAEWLVGDLDRATKADDVIGVRAMLALASDRINALYSIVAALSTEAAGGVASARDEIQVSMRAEQAEALRNGAMKADATIDEVVTGALVAQGLVPR